MEILKTEGIVLDSLNFKETDQILSVFTRDLGKVSFFVKKGRARPKRGKFLASPLTCAEFSYTKGKGDLLLTQDVMPVSTFFELRSDLEKLEGACKLLRLIQVCQMAEKPAEALYILLKRYLTKIPTFSCVNTAVASFYLKLLRFEGLIALDNQSFQTQRAGCMADFSEEEFDMLYLLALCSSFQQIQDFVISDTLFEKIKTLSDEISLANLIP